MRIYQVGTFRGSKGFTLLELLVVLLILSIFIPLSLANLGVLKQDEKDALFTTLSLEFSLLRETAVTEYMIKYIEFDLPNNILRVGDMDIYKGFMPQREINIGTEYKIKDVIINGEKCTQEKCLMTFYPTGLVDRVIVHFEKGNEEFYSIICDPLTAKIKGYHEYIEEIRGKEGIDAT